jgi:uncharacterized membrane protein
MRVFKSITVLIQEDPRFMRKLNGWLTMFWIAMIPVSYEMRWFSSVTYVSALSLWALVAGHWSTWQVARVEVNQSIETQARADEDLPSLVVEKLDSRERNC